MKRLALIIILSLWTSSIAARSEDYMLAVAYVDVAGGALTTEADGRIPVPDDCWGQILLDVDSMGQARPQLDGSPGRGDALLVVPTDSLNRGFNGVFRVNGGRVFNQHGFYLCDSVAAGTSLPDQDIFLRVWNAASPVLATGYWDSWLIRLQSGNQQISFLKSQWTYHEFASPAQPSAITDPVELALSDELLEAWPNPFNSTASIRLNLDKQSLVTARVFDLQGRQVTELLNQNLPAGAHRLQFDGGVLPSGLYFVRAETSEKTMIKRLLLIK